MNSPEAVGGSATGVAPRTPARAQVRRPLGWLRLHPALVAVVGGCATLVHQAMHIGLAGDVYFHWAAGTWMVDHTSVLRRDIFSYTVHGRPWLDDEWGFDFALAWLDRTIGPVTFWLLSGGCCAGAVAVGAATWRRSGAGWLWTALLACLATAGLLPGLAVRPQDASYLFFAVELLLLALARRRTRWLVASPPLLLVWANVHGSFLLGLAILVLELIWSVLPPFHGRLQVSRRLPTRVIGLTAVAALLATLVNPHGPALLSYTANVISSTQLTSLIEEWQSPNFHGLLILFLVVVPLFWLLATLGFSGRVLALEDVVLALLIFVATLHAVRFLPYFVLAVCAALSRASPLRSETLRPTVLTVPLAVVLAAALLAGSHPPAGQPVRGHSSTDMPVDAAAFLQRQSGRTFSTYWWGDYLTYVGVPVFVDGRTDLYFGSGVLATYTKVANLQEDPDTVFRQWDVRWVLWNRGGGLSLYLSKDPRWKRVLTSGPAVVYEHVGAWS